MNFFSSESAAALYIARRAIRREHRAQGSQAAAHQLDLVDEPHGRGEIVLKIEQHRVLRSISASLPPEFGSLRTTSGCVNSWPPTESFTV